MASQLLRARSLCGALILSSLVVGGSGLAACSSDPDPAKPAVDSGSTVDSETPLPDGGATDGGDTDGGPVVVDQGVQVLGRVDTTLVTDAKTMVKARLSWPGSQIRAKFKGTEVKASFRETGGAGGPTFSQYLVSIDDAVVKTLKLKDGATIDEVLATGLPDAEHTVTIYRKTETQFGTTSFEGFDFGTGTVLPIERPARRIEFIGDSITAGYGVDFRGPFDKDYPGVAGGFPPGPASATCWTVADSNAGGAIEARKDAENAMSSYGAVMGASLKAEVSLVAWSGKGVVLNFEAVQTEKFPEVYDRAFAGTATPKWDFTKWTPDLVVVNLGTNDFLAAPTGDPGVAFSTAYENLLKRIRANHPNAWIYAIVGPMVAFGGPREKSLEYIKDGAVKRLNTAGDTKIKVIEVLHTPSDLSKVGCEGHPYKDTNINIADKIAGEAKLDIGWR